MSLAVGIIGLPNVGKSTLFKALTAIPVGISNYPFTTIEPNVGIVPLPDERLDRLAHVLKPEKKTPATVTFIDIAGLVRGAHEGAGLGNQFLSHIREVNVTLHVVRAFEGSEVSHTEITIDPSRDIEIVNIELAMKDLETLEHAREEITKKIKGGDKKAGEELEVIDSVKPYLDRKGEPPNQEALIALRPLNLLSFKKTIYVFNVRSALDASMTAKTLPQLPNAIPLDIKLEEEISELTEEERKTMGMSSQLPTLIRLAHETLGLITFYTVKGGHEIRAWSIENGKTAQDAAYTVHTDFGEKFIRAEVTDWQTFNEITSWNGAREKGKLRTEGRNYIMRDGDVIEFKI